MPRIFRLLPETGIIHILMRGNNRQRVFKDPKDYQHYLSILKLYKEEHGFLLYHYCLMPNHIHLILETTPKTNLSKLMKQINLRYAHYFRRRYRYWGHLWQGRFKSLLIERDSYLIACGRYVEMNPVRAKIINDPKDYPWSTYQFYAYGKRDDIVDIDPLYQELGKSEKEKQLSYRLTYYEESKPNLNVRFLGSSSFINRMEAKFGVKNLKNRKGRPAKGNK
ncbi:MAG: transposase [Thermodesulfobacteriota bacterium]